MKRPPTEIANDVIRLQRRRMGATSPEVFARIYLQRHLSIPSSQMHCELFALLHGITTDGRGARLAVAAPRGHAKSTIVSLAYVLWCICYQYEKFILIVSDTASQANDLLGHVKNELESNPLLQADFPDVAEPPGVRPGPPRWRQDEIITRNEVRVAAFGAQKKVRGRRFKEHRPSLIVVDDLENEELVASADRREKSRSWFEKTLLKSGDHRTNVVVVGTIMHYDALLAELVDHTKSPAWTGRIYRALIAWPEHADLWENWEAVYHHRLAYLKETGPAAARAYYEKNQAAMEDGAQVLWPERENLYQLMELRASEGMASFDSEKQNEPINPRDCVFQENDMVFWDDKFASLQDLLAAIEYYEFIGACDPSLGKAGKNRDDTAIITLLRDRENGTLYVIDADIVRLPPDAIIARILEYQRLREYESFGIECNQFQDFLADELERRSNKERLYLPVRRIVNRGDKMGRIQKLQPLVKSGAIQFSRRHKTLLDQLRQFPKAAHDDGPDALEMAVECAKINHSGPMFYGISTGPYGEVEVWNDQDIDEEFMWE